MLHIEDFAMHLKHEIQDRRITQTTLAAMAGVTSTDINKMVNGRISPRLDTAVRLCNALGVSLDYLLRGDNE